VLTTELASACFGHPLVVTRQAGRWAAVSGQADGLAVPARAADAR
jgi:hypothetical protein